MTHPQDFFWGVATSGYQIEGGYNQADQPKNNWFHVEQNGAVMQTGIATDFWNRYKEDFRLAQQLGLNSFRIGLEWARIQPSSATNRSEAPPFDRDALDEYSDRLAACRLHGLEPIVTLHHFTHPAWLGVDAWLSEPTVDAFAEYVRVAVSHINRRLVDRHQMAPIRWYITINEPNILLSNTYLSMQFPSDVMAGADTLLLGCNHLLAAHTMAYNIVHDFYQAEGWDAPQVTLNTYCSDLYWSEKIIWDLLMARDRQIAFADLPAYTNTNAKELEAALKAANLPFQHNLPYQLGRLTHWFSNRFFRRNFNPQRLARFWQELERSPRAQVFDYLAIDYYDPFIAHIFRLPSFSDFEFRVKDIRGWLMSGITSKWWDWRCLPEGLHFFCQFYAKTLSWDGANYRYPILIAENGMALRRRPDNSVATHRTDQMRRSYFLEAHVQQVQRLLDEGIPMLGYLHWSLTDNYEWGSYTPRFGLYTVDYKQGGARLVEDHLGDRPAETYARLIQAARQAKPSAG
jgi:beta-glucosidase